MRAKKIYIGGKWIDGTASFEVVSPYEGNRIADVSAADTDQAFAAIDHAAAAAVEMRSIPRYRLREGLSNISGGIAARAEEFAVSIAGESAKPLKHSRIEVERAVATFRIAATEAERFCGEIVPVELNAASEGRFGYTEYVPRGVVFGITPFNYPLNLVAHKVAPALASRNSIIIKPSEKTPLTSLLLAEVFEDSGLPASSFQVVPMELDVLSEVLFDERIAMISFTGSDKVGWDLKKKHSKKAIALELGGNAPVIVDKTADLENAASKIVAGAFGYSGQVCISVQRILAETTIEKQLLESIEIKTRKLIAGDPLSDATDISVMISKEAAERTIETIETAVEGGARIVFGGKRDGSFVEPTIVADVDPEMKLVRDEIFAPVAVFETFTGIEEAVALANTTRFGLQAGLFSDSHSSISYGVENLEYGGVIVNDVPAYRVDNMPYGGIKDSGFGREGVVYAMREMCELKTVVIK